MGKILGLKLHNGKFDANIALNVESKEKIYWRINNIFESFAPFDIPDPDIALYTDANLTVWSITDGKTPSGGRWDENEINSQKCVRIESNSIW